MAPGLNQDTLARIDQDHRQLCSRCASDHVARVLLVAGGVGDDELAPVRGEEAVGNIDGDPLLPLGREPVDEQGEVDLLALRSKALRIGLERRELVLEDELGVVQEPPDQRALAVVDTAAGQEPQRALGCLVAQVSFDCSRHQK